MTKLAGIVNRIALSGYIPYTGSTFSTGLLTSDSSGNVSSITTVPFATTFTDGIIITPTSGSGVEAIKTTQTGGAITVADNTGGGGYAWNQITCNTDNLDVTSGGRDIAFSVSMTTGGSNSNAKVLAMLANLNHNVASATGNDHLAFAGLMTSSVSDTSGGELYGGNFVTHATSACSTDGVNGWEVDVQIDSGATVTQGCGIRSINQGGAQPSGIWPAYAIGSNNTGGNFKTGLMLFSYGPFSEFPLASTADFIGSNVSGTITNFANLSNLTITGDIMNFTNYTVTGAGIVTSAGENSAYFNINAIGSAPGNGIYGYSANSLGFSTGNNYAMRITNGQKLLIGFTADQSTGILQANGQISGTAINVTGSSAATNGIYENTTNNLGFATNSTYAASFDSNQAFNIGYATNIGTGPSSTTQSLLQVAATSTAIFHLLRFSNDTGAPSIAMGKSRGATLGTNTTVTSGDELFAFQMVGADGTNWPIAGSIAGFVDAAVSSGIVPGRWQFNVTNTSGTTSEVMRLISGVKVLMGYTSDQSTGYLQVNGIANATGFSISGSSSGVVSIAAGAASAGTYNFNLPTTAGSAGNFLTSQGGSTSAMTWTATVPASAGGTGVNGASAANGSLLIGNGTGFSLATLTAGANITITNSSGGISIAASGGGGGGSGTVTSVTFTGDGTVLSSTPSSAVTSSGTLTATLNTQSANKIFAGPTTGSATSPTFRSLVGADLPNPASGTLGGIESYAAVTNQWINAISTSGVPSSTQPAMTNISDFTGLTSFSPTVTTSGTVGTPAYSTQSGYYMQINSMVICWGNIVLSGWTGSPTGNVSIGALPVTAGSGSPAGGGVALSYTLAGLFASTYGITLRVASSTTTALLLSNGNASDNAVTAADFGTTGSIIFYLIYHT